MHIWERPEWPTFRYDATSLMPVLGAARFAQGRLLGALARLAPDARLDAQLAAQSREVTTSSAIEGERLDAESVRSSIARRLGIAHAVTTEVDRGTDGVVEMMLDATRDLSAPLDEVRLFSWHRCLFPTGGSPLHPVRAGAYRDDAGGPMRVLSGPIGRERVHFEAPPAIRVPTEMQRFFAWFARRPEEDGIVRAALAHLWFVTIHPFDDGNGRLARAIGERALAQAEGTSQRLYGLSAQIQRERAAYYDVLSRTQRGGLDVTPWLRWFVACFTSAMDDAENSYREVVRKAGFWLAHRDVAIDERARRVLNRVLDGFDGSLTTKRWAALAKVSVPTAQRDINALIASGVLRREPGGSKNTRYGLVYAVSGE